MRGRRLIAMGSLVVLGCVGVACAPATPPVPQYFGEPPYCPYDHWVVQSNGDSIGEAYTRQMRLPEPYSLFNAAQGASTFTIDRQVPLIADRVKDWIDRCGTPGAVVIQGGISDVIHSVPLAAIEAAVSALSDWLADRGVPTVWVAIHPFPRVSPYMAHDEARRAYNTWLASDGNVQGSVVDCGEALGDPEFTGTMRRSYWKIVDLAGNPDGLHMNAAGYTAMADCVVPTVLSTLHAG